MSAAPGSDILLGRLLSLHPKKIDLALDRIQRLLEPPPQPRLPARAARLAACAAAFLIPAAIASLPLVIAACGMISTAP